MSDSRSRLVFWPVLLAAILSGSWAAAQEDPYPTGPEAGSKLASELRSIKPEEGTNWNGILKIVGRGKKIPAIPISSQLTVTDTNWSVTYQTAPTDTNVAEKLTVVFSTNGPNQYLYARATGPGKAPGEMKVLSGAEANIPLGGSDFWLSDLGLEFLHWPDQYRMKGDMRSGRPCFVLISSDPHPAPGGYSRVKTWIEKESGQPLEAEAFRSNDTNKTLKSFSLGSVAKVNGRYQVKEMEITSGKSRTRLEIDVEKPR